MKNSALIAVMAFTLTACSQGVEQMSDRTASPCGDKPNCVSTIDNREKHSIAPYTLKADTTIDDIESIALTLAGAKTAEKEGNYLRIECTSKIMRFVDDLELKIEGNNLVVRSESRTGYSDFGVNRKRANELRSKLKDANLLAL
ncbi:DUF1499 domain-containing protein [Vibrio astriarenae]|uniref:DUF1499 domain-containing protein n=1 Tax=Vibrio astriarenae TaxID=1481923 RepID=A0A7Z2T4N6_9VIBR|nr:DUF1499 domain-containing protein [Vibrio astriarenae]QIA64147.1 DUF1499 domain-containing protein [Vibrio astriarenae]